MQGLFKRFGNIVCDKWLFMKKRHSKRNFRIWVTDNISNNIGW